MRKLQKKENDPTSEYFDVSMDKLFGQAITSNSVVPNFTSQPPPPSGSRRLNYSPVESSPRIRRVKNRNLPAKPSVSQNEDLKHVVNLYNTKKFFSKPGSSTRDMGAYNHFVLPNSDRAMKLNRLNT